MNFKEVIKLSNENIIVLPENKYDIEMVRFDWHSIDWSKAKRRVRNLNVCGYTNWKIPTVEEMKFITTQINFEEMETLAIGGVKSDPKFWTSDVAIWLTTTVPLAMKSVLYKSGKECPGDNCNHLLNCCYIRYAEK